MNTTAVSYTHLPPADSAAAPENSRISAFSLDKPRSVKNPTPHTRRSTKATPAGFETGYVLYILQAAPSERSLSTVPRGKSARSPETSAFPRKAAVKPCLLYTSLFANIKAADISHFSVDNCNFSVISVVYTHMQMGIRDSISSSKTCCAPSPTCRSIPTT